MKTRLKAIATVVLVAIISLGVSINVTAKTKINKRISHTRWEGDKKTSVEFDAFPATLVLKPVPLAPSPSITIWPTSISRSVVCVVSARRFVRSTPSSP